MKMYTLAKVRGKLNFVFSIYLICGLVKLTHIHIALVVCTVFVSTDFRITLISHVVLPELRGTR